MADPSEVPEISNAYSLVHLLNLSFLDTTPHTVRAREEFTFGVNLKLMGDWWDSAAVLRETFIDWGNRYSDHPELFTTSLDFGMAGMNKEVLIRSSKELHFGRLAEHGLFSDAGYSTNLKLYAPDFAGSYSLIVRLRGASDKLEDLSLQSERIKVQAIEVKFNPLVGAQKHTGFPNALNLLKTIGASGSQAHVGPLPIPVPAKVSAFPPQTIAPHKTVKASELAAFIQRHSMTHL